MEVKYISHMGTDLSVVNAARVSFAKESAWEKIDEFEGIVFSERLSDRDAKLILYLASHGHWTPFAHPQITLHVKAPIFVRTQCFKHKVGFVENEVSRRYVDDEPEFYTPHVWRGRAEDKKQGSAGVVETAWASTGWTKDWDGPPETCPINRHIRTDREQVDPAALYKYAIVDALHTYLDLIDSGVAPEQARMVLPQSMMTEWYWTGSLAAWARFYTQRTKPDAQAETSTIAYQCGKIIAPLFPISWKALTK